MLMLMTDCTSGTPSHVAAGETKNIHTSNNSYTLVSIGWVHAMMVFAFQAHVY